MRLTDVDGSGYSLNGVWTVSTDALFARSGCASREYFEAAGDKMYATIAFTGKELADGYQYIQILTDNSTTCDDKDGDGAVNTPSLSVCKACFELNGASGSYDSKDHSFFVPHRYNYASRTKDIEAGITEFYEFCDSGKLHAQAYKNSSFKASNTGALVLSLTVQNISVRFNARGSGNDDWKVKNMFARLAIVDTKNPYVIGVGISRGPNKKHNPVTVTLVFNEIVTTTGGVILHTTWGDLTAEATGSANLKTLARALYAYSIRAEALNAQNP